VQNFWLVVLLHIPSDTFTCIETVTTLTYLLIGTVDPAGLGPFFEWLYTFTRIVCDWAFIINDTLLIYEWSGGAEELEVAIQRDKEYFQFWRTTHRNLDLENPLDESFQSVIQGYEELYDEEAYLLLICHLVCFGLILTIWEAVWGE